MGKLKEIIGVFFKLGCIAFGGPASHIAMMQDEIIEKRKWISQQHFLDLIGITNLIPGPNSTEMTMHCGFERAGWKGLFAAGISFIFPAVVITCIFAWLYTSYGHLPEVEPFIMGIKPAVIAIILSASYKLGKKAIKSVELAIIAGLVVIYALLGYHEIFGILLAGAMGLALYLIKQPKTKVNSIIPIIPLITVSQLKIFLTFLKVGAILYGSGYVLFAYLDAELVATGLLTRAELMDAVAVGQMTPGPVLSTATFIGWQLGGFKGAMLATVGIFVPSFIFVGLINPLLKKIRKSKMLSAVLNAVNAGAVAVIVAVVVEMGIETVQDWRSIVIMAITIGLVFGLKKLNSAFIVLIGAVLGYLLSLI
ncbi:chromate efflux transporter [Saprospiraceae bacterium]|nr:chromate efflux transporter [Saprospiraceae bacterium]